MDQPQCDLQTVQLLDKYSRWREDVQRRETWPEVCERVVGWMQRAVGYGNVVDYNALHQAMLEKSVLPSMRVVQMAGKSLDRCHVGVYNCAYLPLQDTRSFAELLYILMQGTGVGFSVEQQYVDLWPVVAPKNSLFPVTTYVVPDTTEGWCDALELGIRTWLHGGDVVYDFSQIRPHGAPLKTKGGTASGPEPLKNLLDFARTLIQRHEGRKLSSLNLHDLACYCGSIVQVGGVRRAAEISLSDVGDAKLAHAKTGRFYEQYPERMMANNSAVYTHKPTMEEWFQQWQTLMTSGTGERGIFNREGVVNQLPSRRESVMDTPHGRRSIDFGVNPCGEIILRPFQFCNLSISVARPEDTVADLRRKVVLATQWGLLQSCLTQFTYIRPAWKENCEEERLLGVDITGQMDNPYLWGSHRMEVYDQLREAVVTEARRLSSAMGVRMPTATTCVKPSGNSSQLLGCASGIHPRYAPYYIRRLRIGAGSPVADLLRAAHVPHHPEIGQSPTAPRVWVFDFPVASPVGALVRRDLTAIDQLEQWLACKIAYTEHNPSVTIYVREHEWMTVGGWVYDHWDYVGGLSFLPYDGGSYMLAPYEEITEQQYHQLVSQWPTIDFSTLTETVDTTTVNQEYACVGGVCEL